MPTLMEFAFLSNSQCKQKEHKRVQHPYVSDAYFHYLISLAYLL